MSNRHPFVCPKAPTGRPIHYPRDVRTVRDHLRRHLREEGQQMQHLAAAWGVTKHTVYALFNVDRPLPPQHVEASIAHLGLDAFDANELRLLAAREAGWQIDPQFLIDHSITRKETQ